jgi:hypothetical protein
MGWVDWAQDELVGKPPITSIPDPDDEEIEHERNTFNKQLSAVAEKREKLAKLREEQVKNR